MSKKRKVRKCNRRLISEPIQKIVSFAKAKPAGISSHTPLAVSKRRTQSGCVTDKTCSMQLIAEKVLLKADACKNYPTSGGGVKTGRFSRASEAAEYG